MNCSVNNFLLAAAVNNGTVAALVAALIILIAILLLFVVIIPIPLWIAAVFSGVRISIFSLIGMRLRRVPPAIILNAMIQIGRAHV